MSIKLKHSGGNSVSLNPPTSAPTSSEVAFKLPNADGSADQVIKTDGSGNLAFAGIPASGAAAGNMFRAKMNGGYNTSNNTNGEIIFQAEDFDLGSAYNHTNGRFTPNIAGYYFIDASLQFSNATGNYHFSASIWKNGSEWTNSTMWNDGSNGENHVKVSSIVYVNGSSDYISIIGWQNSGGNITINAGTGSYFNAFFLRTS